MNANFVNSYKLLVKVLLIYTINNVCDREEFKFKTYAATIRFLIPKPTKWKPSSAS